MCGTTKVENKPPEQTDAQKQADILRLQELQRQNELANEMLPNQKLLIQQQSQLLKYQIDHQGDLDELHTQQLHLAQLQIQQQIADSAMQEQLRPQQLQFLQNQNALAIQQISALGEATAAQKEQNQYILAAMKDQATRLAARNAAYSPEEEAQAAADEARRATRMSAISEEAANIQLENLKRGNKPTDEELANINEAYDATQERGESDITRYLKETLHQINEETAQASGLRSTDTPTLRLSERAGEEAARAQGNLTETVAQGRATARLNYPLAASKLTGDQAATLGTIASGAANFQDQLRLAAVNNRQQAFQLPSSIGFAMPQPYSSTSPNLSFMSPSGGVSPNLGLNIGGGSPGGSNTSAAPNYGQIASGIGSLIAGYAAFAAL